MKRLTITLALVTLAISGYAQGGYGEIQKDFHLFDFTFNAKRLEAGITLGQVGSFSEYARFGMGANLLVNGVYLDFIEAGPQHKYNGQIKDIQWNDNCAFSINAGYQIPVLKWLRIMPLVGYAQTNEGVTDGSSLHLSFGEETTTWYHDYKVTPGSRVHYLNYGGGISVQPCKWFSVNAIVTRCAIYGGFGIDIISIAKAKLN